MANIWLTLDLKAKRLYDDDDLFNFEFNHWEYDLKSRIFKLDDLTINYDLIAEIKFDRNIKTDLADAELEDNSVLNVDVYNEYDKYLESDLSYVLEDFIADKDLPDGEYKVKYTYYYDFGDEEFVCEVQEVEAK